MYFGSDNNIFCVLLSVSELNAGVFGALVDSNSNHYPYDRNFWANSSQTHKVIVLCRTQAYQHNVGLVGDLSSAQIGDAQSDANKNGYVTYVAQLGSTYAMVYYK